MGRHQVETEANGQPSLVIIEGLDFETVSREEILDIKALAGELAAEVWFSVSSNDERIESIPAGIANVDDLVSVVLALEPGDGAVLLRALKDHANADLSELHVALDPRTLLLTRH